jgi:release factor glutamine methyltransferase
MFVQRNDVRSLRTYFQDRLKEHFSLTEIKLIVRDCVCRRLGLSFSDYVISDDFLLSESDLLYFRSIVKRLQSGQPFQYISGNIFFYGLELYIAPGALIPRPETEELVDWISKEHQDSRALAILDVCSGSGCIAFGLEQDLKNASVLAMELSEDACSIWNVNKERLKSNATLLKMDALDSNEWQDMEEASLDIIVSNPPYIVDSERNSIAKNVLEYEPHMSLFVPSADPLLFYKAIIVNGITKLRKGGKFYFELNPLFSEEVVQYMREINLVNIELRKDLQGKDRMLMGQKP